MAMLGPIATGVSAVGAFAGSRARSRALKADAVAEQQAGAAESADILREGRRAQGAGAAVAGASGVTLEGSAVDVLAQMAAENATSAGRARWDASRRALRLRNEAAQVKRQGTFDLVTGLMEAGAETAELVASAGAK